VLAVLGVVVLVVAVIAISEPKSHTKDAGGAPSSTAPASSTAPRTSASPTPTRSSAKPSSSLSLGETTPAPSSASSSASGAAKLPLVVLNNTTTNGLATDAAQAFRNGGWTVSDIGNLQDDIVSSCAYYDPSVDGAKAAATALRTQFPGIRRVVEKFSELPSGPVVVVLTSDYSGG
jgi:hypothetical protein